MAKLPPKKESGDSQEWLNTYADMVTLLLTFFVLLFACSNLDETKLQWIYQAFKMRGKYVNPIVYEQNSDPSAESSAGITDSPSQSGGDGNMPQNYPELYQYLAEYIDSNSLSSSVSVEDSGAYLTLRFDSSVLFDGDSHILKDEGRQLLVGFAPKLHALDPYIKLFTVIGHTSAGSSPVSDWNLSSLRACSVVNFFESGIYEGLSVPVISPEKFRTRGCGNTEPRFPNDTEENRAKNRRVEMVMVKSDIDMTSGAVLKDIMKHDLNMDPQEYDQNNPTKPETTTLPEGSADKIVSFIGDTFKNDGASHVGTTGPNAVDESLFIETEETESGGDEGNSEE